MDNPKLSKKWLVNYSMYDGESEYDDMIVLEAKCKRAANSVVKKFFSEFWGDDTKRNGDIYEEKGGCRAAQIDSVAEIPDNDFNVLIKYVMNISGWESK